MPRGYVKGSGELSVVACSVQAGIDRFAKHEVPAAASGRNNLTAISSAWDLFFVAIYDEIHVHRPWFPNQTLSDRLYKWTLPVSAHGLQGYIDRRQPHAINALLIDDLGKEEVLVCACDDGDVLLYYTKPIQAMVEAVEDQSSQHQGNLRPFLVQNVGKSAWGLAIHTNARMLAVSSNTHCITVFAFALTDDSALYSDPDAEWQFPGRSKDVSLNLHAHEHNIPNVAFFNSNLDKEGRFLLSTDLTGKIILWDLRERAKLKEIIPSRSSLSSPRSSGWSVGCIDPRSCLLARTENELLGSRHLKNAHGTYDITQSRSVVADASIQYPMPGRVSRGRLDANVIDTIRQQVATTRSHLLDLLEEMDRMGPASQHGTGEAEVLVAARNANAEAMQQAQDWSDRIDAENNDYRNEDEGGDNEDDDVDYEDENDAEVDDMNFEEASDMMPVADFFHNPVNNRRLINLSTSNIGTMIDRRRNIHRNSQPPRLFRRVTRGDYDTDSNFETLPTYEEIGFDTQISSSEYSELSDFDDDAEPSLQTIWPESHERSTLQVLDKSMERRSERPEPTPMDHFDIPFLLLHAGQDFVSLSQAPYDDLKVISRDPCHQHLPPNMSWLEHLDRLHLTRAIPELNLVIIATATGRAAMYTTTRKINALLVPPMDEYGLRLDFILPFASQEGRNERPAAALIGIVAAPTQGHEGRPGVIIHEQRWRLLLTYSDHTVMTYELWRKGNAALAASEF